MSEVVISVENLSKQYRLGLVGTGTLKDDFNRWWHALRGKEDPYLKIGEENDRTKKGHSDYVWALKDVSFEVNKGEVLGVIGRNGAGKSTLLKILSRTTTPTLGSIKMKGRVASLLEVGTGFHPELSGRDNIFLNGSILGMTHSEIRTKFDEIIDFSGVERYIDTPVKRYSSGMYVRLAFAVAAHLDPEILIVDEVLAVGDAEFQKKCIGKLKDVSNKEGRTILFVSHNLDAVKSLCTKSVLMQNGRLSVMGDTEAIIGEYVKNNIEGNVNKLTHKVDSNVLRIINVSLDKDKDLKVFDDICLRIKYNVLEENVRAEFFVLIYNENEECIIGTLQGDQARLELLQKGEAIINVKIKNILVPGRYYISVGVFDPYRSFIDWVEYCTTFTVSGIFNDNRLYTQRSSKSIAEAQWI